MAHAYVPSKNDLRVSTVENMVKTIEDQHIYDEAHKVLDRLKQDIDEETIMFKLISMILDKQDIKGPNNIGIPADRIEAILERANQRGGGGRDFKGRSRNRSGGSSSGGGYRGSKPSSGGGSGGGSRERGTRDGGGGGYRGNSSSSGSRGRSTAGRGRD